MNLGLLTLFISLFLFETVLSECVDISHSATVIHLEDTKRVTRIAISGHISAYRIQYTLSDGYYEDLKQLNGNPLVIYSTLSHLLSWTHIDMLANSIRIQNAFGRNEKDIREPLITLTVCDYASQIRSFDDSGYTVETHLVGLSSMYENELLFTFRSFRSGIFFFSMADQGDILIAQVIHGTIHVVFDFGSLSPSHISGGRALDDGKWHEVKWVHQFDSVQLIIDGVLLNHTTPTGMYRKLDLHNQIHIAGRPVDDISDGIEATFTGCIARLQLNNIDLLQYAPKEHHRPCEMSKPPSLTLQPSSSVYIPFTFLPFSFEFRVLPQASSLLKLLDAENITLLSAEIQKQGYMILTTNATKYTQKANPAISISDGSWHSFSLRIRGARLEVDIDGKTVLWLEGLEVRRISLRLASLLISTPGCYRSATIDFSLAYVEGNVVRDACQMIERCLPSPCENGGVCVQNTLVDYQCNCTQGYRGKNCHTSDLPRSCEEWLYLRGSARSKVTRGRNVTLDLDGGGPLKSINVVCKAERDELGEDVMSTIVDHDLNLPMIVTGENPPGAVRKSLNYQMSTEQLDRLVEGFESCTQFMSYKCIGGVGLMSYGDDRSPSSWYSTRSDKHGLQWGDAPPYSRMCSCAINGTCTQNRMCNCDSGQDGIDEGFNSYSQLLPITALFIGGTTKTSSAQIEIGHLKCRHRLSFEPVTFSDRNARITGSKIFSSRTFDLSVHLKFTHSHMTVFSWESADSLHWFHLYIHEGRFIGEIVNGGETSQISTNNTYNDGKWHSVYYEADETGMILKVDGRSLDTKHPFILPSALHWTIGSRTERGNSGFAGVIRNAYLCGEELMLSNIAKREGEKGYTVGESGYCRSGLCKNGGECIDRFDGYSCDCSITPFGGDDCTKDFGMWVPLGSSLQIPWQNPAHSSDCHRIAIQSRSTNVSLLSSKALFADSKFNMRINENGFLSLSVHDGVIFHHKNTAKRTNLSDDTLHDIEFCADSHRFNLTIDGEPTINFEGNWTFFQNFNVWTFLDLNFTGCVSRLQVGNSFPLKNPREARLKYSGKIRFGTCPMDTIISTPPAPIHASSFGIQISSVNNRSNEIVSITSLVGLAVVVFLILLLILTICYMRTRPEGVYKTNEGKDNCSPSSYRSEEPLVRGQTLNNNNNKEYFC